MSYDGTIGPRAWQAAALAAQRDCAARAARPARSPSGTAPTGDGAEGGGRWRMRLRTLATSAGLGSPQDGPRV